MQPRRVLAALLSTIACTLVVLQSSCATSGDTLGDPIPILVPAEASTSSLCVETQCPPPFATCPDSKAPCATNLNNDVDNCGACGHACPPSTQTETWVCSEGVCRLACSPYFANCNEAFDDGCEVATFTDRDNCGFCGNKCADGVLCWKGACGCPNGFTQCGDDCVQTQSNNDHCGACDTPCVDPTSDTDPRWKCGPNVKPPNTMFQCAESECTLQCRPGFEDCNMDFCGDGCETDVREDPLNCGACGHACGPDQICKGGTCLCPPGTTRCGTLCVDLQRDTAHCGACFRKCGGPRGPGGGPACENGKCVYTCYPGWADCDNYLGNGCEANLDTDQKNCGACGNRCETALGQPCVRGQCLTKPCEHGPLR